MSEVLEKKLKRIKRKVDELYIKPASLKPLKQRAGDLKKLVVRLETERRYANNNGNYVKKNSTTFTHSGYSTSMLFNKTDAKNSTKQKKS